MGEWQPHCGFHGHDLPSGNQTRYPKFGYTPGWSAYTYKLGPAPNASASGSTALNLQASIGTVSDYTFSYTSTTTTITWSWRSFNVYCPDGNTYAVAASTGSATTETSLSTTVSGTTPFEWTGLTASHTYYFTPFVSLNSNGTGRSALWSQEQAHLRWFR